MSASALFSFVVQVYPLVPDIKQIFVLVSGHWLGEGRVCIGPQSVSPGSIGVNKGGLSFTCVKVPGVPAR